MTISREQAQELLDGSQAGEWLHGFGPDDEPHQQSVFVFQSGDRAYIARHLHTEDARLIAAGPDLARTVVEQVDRLGRLRDLHTIRLLMMVFDSDCATEVCCHDDCPTYPLEVCGHCHSIAEDGLTHGALGTVPKSSEWPCTTIRAIDFATSERSKS